jgi:hypothetical protein
MKIIEYRLEGEYKLSCLRPTVELSDGRKIMLGFADATNIDSDFERLATESGEAIPNLKTLKELVLLVPLVADNFIIKDDIVLVQETGKSKEFKSQVAPLDNPLEVAPDVIGIDEICAIVHTDKVKRNYVINQQKSGE